MVPKYQAINLYTVYTVLYRFQYIAYMKILDEMCKGHKFANDRVSIHQVKNESQSEDNHGNMPMQTAYSSSEILFPPYLVTAKLFICPFSLLATSFPTSRS